MIKLNVLFGITSPVRTDRRRCHAHDSLHRTVVMRHAPAGRLLARHSMTTKFQWCEHCVGAHLHSDGRSCTSMPAQHWWCKTRTKRRRKTMRHRGQHRLRYSCLSARSMRMETAPLPVGVADQWRDHFGKARARCMTTTTAAADLRGQRSH